MRRSYCRALSAASAVGVASFRGLHVCWLGLAHIWSTLWGWMHGLPGVLCCAGRRSLRPLLPCCTQGAPLQHGATAQGTKVGHAFEMCGLRSGSMLHHPCVPCDRCPQSPRLVQAAYTTQDMSHDAEDVMLLHGDSQSCKAAWRMLAGCCTHRARAVHATGAAAPLRPGCCMRGMRATATTP